MPRISKATPNATPTPYSPKAKAGAQRNLLSAMGPALKLSDRASPIKFAHGGGSGFFDDLFGGDALRVFEGVATGGLSEVARGADKIVPGAGQVVNPLSLATNVLTQNAGPGPRSILNSGGPASISPTQRLAGLDKADLKLRRRFQQQTAPDYSTLLGISGEAGVKRSVLG